MAKHTRLIARAVAVQEDLRHLSAEPELDDLLRRPPVKVGREELLPATGGRTQSRGVRVGQRRAYTCTKHRRPQPVVAAAAAAVVVAVVVGPAAAAVVVAVVVGPAAAVVVVVGPVVVDRPRHPAPAPARPPVASAAAAAAAAVAAVAAVAAAAAAAAAAVVAAAAQLLLLLVAAEPLPRFHCCQRRTSGDARPAQRCRRRSHRNAGRRTCFSACSLLVACSHLLRWGVRRWRC